MGYFYHCYSYYILPFFFISYTFVIVPEEKKRELQALLVLFRLVSVSQNLLDCDYIENILCSYNPLPLFMLISDHIHIPQPRRDPWTQELGNSEEIKSYEGKSSSPKSVIVICIETPSSTDKHAQNIATSLHNRASWILIHGPCLQLQK